MAQYRTIFFDLDGTLTFNEPDVWLHYAQFAREAGLLVSDDATRRAERFAHFYFAGQNFEADLKRVGTARFRQKYITRVLEAMGGAGDLDSATEHILQRLRETPRTRFVPPEAHATLAQLRTRGYTLGLVTNRRADELDEAYHPFDLNRYFAFTVNSSEAGRSKPDRAMFDLALARAACAAHQAMHIGDNWYADVAGAQGVGITPVLLDPKGLFPEATCLVIQSLPQLLNYLP